MENRNCQNCKKDFQIESEDFDFYNKIKVPPPTFCPDCRRQRRLAWYNLTNLFYRNCDLCQQRFISMYPSDASYVVYCPKCWWSEKWDWRDYARDYDFSKPFFDQFNELLHTVPLLGLSINATTTPGSPYNNHAADLKDCYMTFDTDFNQECAYGVNLTQNRQVFDCSMIMSSDGCYDCQNMYKSSGCIGTRGNNRFCIDSAFLRDCENCQDCFMCTNLKNKKYCFKNEQYTKEEYYEKIRMYDLGSYDMYLKATKEAHEFWKQFPPKPSHDNMSVGCTGSAIFESKNCKECYDVANCEDCKYVMMLWRKPQKNCYDVSGFGYAIENIYEGGVVGEYASNIRFAQESGLHLIDAEYTKLSLGGSNHFGCVSVRKGNNVIFNKEYSKEEFLTLRQKIIDHMNDMPYVDVKGTQYQYGEFFPLELSPFPYNKTYAQLFYPEDKASIAQFGGKYMEEEKNTHTPTILSKQIPDHIQDVPESILKEIIGCEECGRGFKLIPIEFSFYRHKKLPVPRRCPFCRIQEKLINWVQKLTLHDRICSKCQISFKTFYTIETAPLIYCKNCYQQEVA